MTSSLAAVLTTYRPDAGFGGRFQELSQLCRALIIVDNTPGGHRFGDLPANAIVLQDGVNKGLGRALNLGIARAIELGCDTVVLFDQDSSPASTLIAGLQLALDSAGPRAVVGPLHIDDKTGRETAVLALTRPDEPLRRVSCLATSGMLFRVVDAPIEPFSEELFLDLVDFEWCWRMGRAGWSFHKATGVAMAHRLGEGQRRFAGLTYHVPAPYRHYFQFRDTLRVVPRSYVPLYPKLRLLGILPLKLLAYPWLMDRGSERLGWMLRGVRDALLGRLGAGAASAKLNT
jgi:rhamnosyltransferase